jgi:hypothetical protein
MASQIRSKPRVRRPAPRSQSGKRSQSQPGITYISKQEGECLLDQQAQKYLGMSGVEFKRLYRAGQIPDSDRSDVIRVSMLIPLSED